MSYLDRITPQHSFSAPSPGRMYSFSPSTRSNSFILQNNLQNGNTTATSTTPFGSHSVSRQIRQNLMTLAEEEDGRTRLSGNRRLSKTGTTDGTGSKVGSPGVSTAIPYVPTAMKKKKVITFNTADSEEPSSDKELLTKSPQYLDWKSICKSKYSIYMRIYKYMLMSSSSSPMLMESTNASLATSVAASTTLASTALASNSMAQTSTVLPSSTNGATTASEADKKAPL